MNMKSGEERGMGGLYKVWWLGQKGPYMSNIYAEFGLGRHIESRSKW